MKNLVLFILLIIIVPSASEAQNGNFEETATWIKNKIACCSSPFTKSKALKVSSIEIDQNGTVKLSYTPRKSAQSFNLFNLLKSPDAPLGIELFQQTKFIQFHVSEERTRLISFSTHAEARAVYNAFIHLIAIKEKSTEAIFYISRYAELKTSNILLASSIRATDKLERNGKEILIESKGEGWLDKDSFPVGTWKFFAVDEKQKEFLFKEGGYQKTNPGMFEVQGIDSADLNDNYHLSIQSLQEYRSKEIPFIKSGNWTYYQPDGKLVKNIDFISHRIPISMSIMMEDPSNNKSTKLAVSINEKADEWIR